MAGWNPTGHGEVKSVDVSGCSGDYCVIHKGKPLELKADFVANQDTDKLKLKIIAKVNGIDVQVPGLDTDGCHYVKCPLKKGQEYTVDYKLNIPKIVPKVKAVVRVDVEGDHGQVGCGAVNGEVQD